MEGGVRKRPILVTAFLVLSFKWYLCFCCAKWKGVPSEWGRVGEAAWCVWRATIVRWGWSTRAGKVGWGAGMQPLTRVGGSSESTRKVLECHFKSFCTVIWAAPPWRYTESWDLSLRMYVCTSYKPCKFLQWRATDRVGEGSKEWHLTGAYCGPVAFTYTIDSTLQNGHSNVGDIIPTLWITKLRVRGYNNMLLLTSLEFMLSARATIYNSKLCNVSSLNSKIC